MPRLPHLLLLLSLLPAAAEAQGSGRFVLIHNGRDTIADETFRHDSAGVTGTLLRGLGPSRQRITYQVTEIGGTTPLIEFGSSLASDPVDAKPRQNVRLIFKGDSVAVDEANDKSGVTTRLFETGKDAVPYLNLSLVFLELATRRAAGKDSATVAFFDLSSGASSTGTVTRVGTDSAVITLGNVSLRLRTDRSGAILGGAVPSQNITMVRGGVP